MKKALFATTALVAFAGAASAEVTISGWAEMGIIGGDRFTGTLPMGTQFWNDVDIEFTLSGESDSGISFGARVDVDEAGNLGNALRNQGTSIFISGNFGTLTMGDTDGAVDWAITDAGNIGNPGSITDDETTHAGYNADYGDGGGIYNGGGPAGPAYDNQVLRYDYSFGDFGVAISYEQDGFVGGAVIDLPAPAGSYDGALGLGVRYALNLGGPTVNLGLGYQTIDFGPGFSSEDIVAASVSGSFGGGFQAGVEFTQYQNAGGVAGEDVNHVGVGLGYESGPFSVHANWGQFEGNATADAGFWGFTGGDRSGWGLAAAYDLGGGLSINAGVGHDDFLAPAVDNTYWSLGMVMSF